MAINIPKKAIHQIKISNLSQLHQKDLSFLKPILKDTSLVLLGEQHHGDGSALLAKTAIIKYLYHELGFKVLAFESGFYECHRIFEQYNHPQNVQEIRKNIYNIWADSEQINPLFDFLETHDDLLITGFDCRHKGVYAQKHLISELTVFLKKFNPSLLASDDCQSALHTLENLLKLEYQYEADTKEQETFYTFIKNSIQQINSAKLATVQSSFWLQELKNLIAFAQNAWAKVDVTIRDGQMANNLAWAINNKFQNEKVIVWAHDFHILKDNKGLNLRHDLEQKNVMGMALRYQEQIDFFGIGFSSYRGTYSSLNFKEIHKIKKSSKESIDFYLDQEAIQYAFIQTKYLDGAMEMQGAFHETHKAQWADIYDGIFFIHTMEASKKISDG